MEKCNYGKCANSIGLFLAILFVLCFAKLAWDPTESDLHLRLLKLTFFGFSGVNVASFILGLAQSYVAAYIGVGIWQLVGCCFKKGECK
ncbi:MAG: hypothetical protein AAB849_02290 [Patescibacteria group bacterium]